MKKIIIITILAVFTISNISWAAPKEKDDKNLIQLAILLDSSSSMSGLINQAKSQIWKIVNELALAQRDGKSPDIEVGLYEYGKSTIPSSEGYLRMLVPLSTDLDRVSDELFKITTNGGNEYCGQVIKVAAESLKWSKSNKALKVIVIAGNEPFTQGSVDYKKACKDAISKGIIVNTIFCGDERTGINTKWKDGADLADGKYMAIDHTKKVVHIEAPQDDEILKLGGDLNKTYIGYGRKGRANKERQVAQDANASKMSKSVMVQRSFTKSSKKYKNTKWDLVDAVENEELKVEEVKKTDLPKEMQKMNKKERKQYVEKKSKERSVLQKKIAALKKERDAYVLKERKKRAGKDKGTLDSAIVNAIKNQAMKKEFKFEK
ncbi:MAG: VWA domain-containing protein [Desulfobacterales bacterium]|nr:VWA domain-containing protein [Desulfobacterales bacterium]MCP4161295.1 VWA domain-containing protein [Deltaproteobacteria bacterium]